MLGTVEEYLNERRARYEKHDKEGLIKCRVEGDQTAYHAVFAANEKDQVLTVYVLFPNKIAEPKRMAVAEFLTHANYGLSIGSFAWTWMTAICPSRLTSI